MPKTPTKLRLPRNLHIEVQPLRSLAPTKGTTKSENVHGTTSAVEETRTARAFADSASISTSATVFVLLIIESLHFHLYYSESNS